MPRHKEEPNLRPVHLARRVAEGQRGLITLEQTRECSVSKDMLYRLLSTGEWTRIANGIFKIFSTGDEWRERCMAVSLWLGKEGALSFSGAARWWGLDGFEDGDVEFSTTSTRKSPYKEVRLHRVREWLPSDRGLSDAIWVTTPTRTLLDLASAVSRDELELALESALRKRLTSVPRLEALVDRFESRGRKGIPRLRDVLERRGPRAAPTESPLETRFLQFLRRWKLPMPQRQYRLIGPNGFIGRFDFFYPHCGLIIEVDGFKHHSGRKSWAKDQTKGNGATALGLRTFRVTEELFRDAPRLAAELRRALGQGDLL